MDLQYWHTAQQCQAVNAKPLNANKPSYPGRSLGKLLGGYTNSLGFHRYFYLALWPVPFLSMPILILIWLFMACRNKAT